jgi:hypothetical protein
MPLADDPSDKHRLHASTAWLSREWVYRAIAVLLVPAPLTLLFIDYYFIPADPVLLFGCGSVISAVIGLNRFKKWVPNPVIDLCGCIVAFVLCALAAVHILLLVSAISISAGVVPEDQIRAYVFSFYTVVNLLGAIQASQRSKFNAALATDQKL